VAKTYQIWAVLSSDAVSTDLPPGLNTAHLAQVYDATLLLLESKQDMRKRGVPSPDEADAVALTFSEPDGSAFVRDKDFHRSLIEKYGGGYV
jgi:hypothetical protein